MTLELPRQRCIEIVYGYAHGFDKKFWEDLTLSMLQSAVNLILFIKPNIVWWLRVPNKPKLSHKEDVLFLHILATNLIMIQYHYQWPQTRLWLMFVQVHHMTKCLLLVMLHQERVKTKIKYFIDWFTLFIKVCYQMLTVSIDTHFIDINLKVQNC